MRLSIRLIALALVVLARCQYVRGDFGIPPVISGATAVLQATTNTLNGALNLELAFGGIILVGPVVEFNEAGAAVVAVYEQIVSLINAVAESVASLAVDDVGPVEALFGDADSKIVAMQTFIASTAPALLDTVQTKVSVFVRNELEDILARFAAKLSNLQSALGALRTGVINARTAAASNGGVYTSANLQSNVGAALVNTLQTRVSQIPADLASALLSASECARTIREANEFFAIARSVATGATLSEHWEGELLHDYQQVTNFLANLESLVSTQLVFVTGQLGQFGADFGPLLDPLGLQYHDVESVYGQVTAGVATNVLNAYKTLTMSPLAFVLEMMGSLMPPIEPAIARLTQILVQRGPFADFCYQRFYPSLEGYLYSGEMGAMTCLDVELGRQKALREALLEVVYQLQFFLEDASAHLDTCHRLSRFDTQLANECLQEHTDFSELIPCTAMKEYATLLQLLCKEVDSIRFRLWTCLSRDTLAHPFDVPQLLLGIEACNTNGPFG